MTTTKLRFITEVGNVSLIWILEHFNYRPNNSRIESTPVCARESGALQLLLDRICGPLSTPGLTHEENETSRTSGEWATSAEPRHHLPTCLCCVPVCLSDQSSSFGAAPQPNRQNLRMNHDRLTDATACAACNCCNVLVRIWCTGWADGLRRERMQWLSGGHRHVARRNPQPRPPAHLTSHTSCPLARDPSEPTNARKSGPLHYY